jgi:hypothetical protein
MRKSWKNKKIERIKKIRSESGKRGNAAKSRKRMELAEREWKHVRTLETRMPDGSLVASWKIFATGDPRAPLGVDFGSGPQRLMAGSRLNALIGRKMFGVARSSI